MGEETYMNKEYCLQCATKHSRDLEHHLEDLVTSSRDNPKMRQLAQEMVDQTRELRKLIDELRIRELAKKRLGNLT